MRYVGDAVSIVLPDQISNHSYGLYDYAFYHNDEISNIIFSNNVTSIGISAFEGCYSLANLILPTSIKDINANAFKDCTSFTEIIVPNSVSYLGEGVLSGCNSLESVTLPFIGSIANPKESSESTVFGYIFGRYNYRGATETSSCYGFNGSAYKSATYYIPTKLKKATITGGKILDGAFSECVMLTTIILPNGITSIGKNAFEQCSGLMTITIPESIQYIENYAFMGCTNLCEVRFLEGLISIGIQAFANCHGRQYRGL